MNSSIKVYFELSSGIAETIIAPRGTYQAIKMHVEGITNKLGLNITQYGDSPSHWSPNIPASNVSNDLAGRTVLDHNKFVRDLYGDLAMWSRVPPTGETEELTPAMFRDVWHGLAFLYLPPDRWSEDFYCQEMQDCYAIMRGRSQQGITFGEQPLTTEQANAVVWLFSRYLDEHDIRLDVPHGYDYLLRGDDYVWCPTHGAYAWEDVGEDDDGNAVCPVEGCNEIVG